MPIGGRSIRVGVETVVQKQGRRSKRKVREATGESAAPRPDQKARNDKRSWIRSLMMIAVAVALILGIWLVGLLGIGPRQRAQQALMMHDFDTADAWLDWAESVSFADGRNAMMRARVARYRGDGVELRRQITRAKALGIPAQVADRELTLAKAQVGQLEDVETLIGAWLQEPNVEADEISNAYANGLAAVGRFSDALNVLTAWKSDYPYDPRCDYRIGRILEHQERYNDAEKSYLNSLRKAPKFHAAHFRLGRLLLHQRRAEEALEQFKICFAMHRPEAAFVEAAVAYKALGQADEARQLLSRVLARTRQEIELAYAVVDENVEGFRPASEYGRLETDAGDFEAALPWLDAALEANPLDLTVRYSRGVALRGLGRMDEAEAEFGHVTAARGRMGAATSLNERIKANPEDLDSRLALGRLILENESEQMGLYWIRSIFSFDPDHQDAHRTLAEYYESRTDRDPRFEALANYHRKQQSFAANDLQTAD